VDVRIDGKVALVTGASRGIGLAIAAELARSGARVMLSSRKPEALAAAVATIDGETAWHAANAGDEAQAAECVAATVARFGAVDVLVNNAATNPYMGPTIDVDRPRLDKTVAVNWAGPLTWSHLAWHASMREHGGAIQETYGVPVEAIVEGIRHGVRKVNIDTDIRLAMTGAMRRAMARDPGEFDPRKFLKDAMAAARDLCKSRFEAFGCSGQAPRIKPLPLERIAARYA